MKRITIINVLTTLMILFSVTVISGYLRAETNDLRTLSTAEMQAFIGQEGCNQCAILHDECQTCYPTSWITSIQYNSGSSVYKCSTYTGGECYDTTHECGTEENGGGWKMYNHSDECIGPYDFDPSDSYMSGAIGTPC